MSQPDGAPQPDHSIEIPNPLNSALERIALFAGRTLTPFEVALASEAFEVGKRVGAEQAAQTPAQSGAAEAAADKAPAEPAKPAATPKAEASEAGSEKWADLLTAYPAWLSVRWDAPKEGHFPLFNTASGQFGDALRAERVSDIDLVIDEAITGLTKRNPGEIVGYTHLPNDDPRTNLLQFPEGRQADDPLLVLEYYAVAGVGKSTDQVSQKLAVPLSIARTINAAIDKDPRSVRNMVHTYFALELRRAEEAGNEKTVAAIKQLQQRFKYMLAAIDATGPRAKLLRVAEPSTGLAGDGRAQRDGYVRRYTPLPPLPKPKTPVGGQPGTSPVTLSGVVRGFLGRS